MAQGQMAGLPMAEGMMGQPNSGSSQGPVPMGPPVEDPYAPVASPESGEEEITAYINAALNDTNLAERFKNKKVDGMRLLDKMGAEILSGVNADNESRNGWMEANKESIKLSMLIRENRSWPWQNAANIKYPLVATAAMQFSARAYPSLVPSDGKIVKVEVNQQNAPEALYDSAKRVSEHMSFQVRERIPNWEEDMDRLLMTMSISGICFKKTYYDSLDNINMSSLVFPENLIINYFAKSLEAAYRKTEVLFYSKNEVEEKIRNKVFLDEDYGQPNGDVQQQKLPNVQIIQPSLVDGATPLVFFAVHTYYDLDDDGYEEPYVITIESKTGKVARIIARWDLEGISTDEKGKVLRIKPIEYFTSFPFIPNPDGSLYGMGFGLLLGPLNLGVNSIINQLIDSGTLRNLASGFISKGLRLKIGETSFSPGEWKVVNATGEALKDGIFPLPSNEPSSVLFQLLGMLIQSGNQLASIAEIFVGKMPGQNTPATTTQETVQQGMAVFTAIYKRVYRSLKKEFKKLYRLNKLYPNAIEEEIKMAGIPVQSSDYIFPDWMICPGADPIGDSSTVKMQKLQFVMQNVMPLGTINPMEVTQRVLKDLELPDAQKLIMEPQPQPDPKMMALEKKAEIDERKVQADIALKEKEAELKEKLAILDMQMKKIELQFEQQKQAIEMQGKMMDQKLDMILKTSEMQFQQRHMEMEEEYNSMSMARDAVHQERMNQQQLRHGDAKFKQQSAQAKQKQKSQAAKPKGK